MSRQDHINKASGRFRTVVAVVLALALVSATLSGCSLGSTIKGWFSPQQAPAAKLTPKVKPPAIRTAGKLYIGVNLGMAPFAGKAQSGSGSGSGYEGFDVELGNAIAKHLGLTPVYVATTPDTMAAALNNNSIDLALSAPGNTPGLVVAQVYYQDTDALFAQSDEASAVAASPLVPKTALQAGSAAEQLLIATMSSTEASATLQPFPQLSGALQAVRNKQVAAIAGDYVVLRYAQINGAQIKFVRSLSIVDEDRGVAVRPDNVELMRELKPVLVSLDKNGAIASMMRSWIGTNELSSLDTN